MSTSDLKRTDMNGQGGAAGGPSVMAPTTGAANRAIGLSRTSAKLLQQAATAIARKQYRIATKALDSLSALAPEHPEVLRLRAVICYAHKKHAEAAALLRRALAQWPDDALILGNLGIMLSELGQMDEAVAMLKRSAEAEPGQPAAWVNLGKALDLALHSDQALVAFERGIEVNPKHVPALVGRARMIHTLGSVDEAAAAYRSVIEAMTDAIEAWTGLANVKTSRMSEREVATLESLCGRPGLADKDRAAVAFSLAKALEDQGRWREAFAILTAANATKRREFQWDGAGFARHVEDVLRAHATPMTRAPDATLGHEVVFIVSMPRSGSTLVEQMLAGHPEIEAASELNVLPEVLDEASSQRRVAYPQWVGKATPVEWQQLGRRYLERTARWQGRRAVFTDKGLGNWRFIGSALSMLPGARFVNVRRDPVETCLSCFRQTFASGQEFTYDLDEVAGVWRAYDRAMRAWLERFPDRVYELVYEELIADPEAELRKLLAFLGFEFDPVCLDFHTLDRAIRTASVAQVREPLRRDTARASRYGDLLAPLRR
ncbi:MAG: sulfotransferase, partial [Rhodanobacteraceae bacterium]